jgi:tetratricopeptide (TPR) repeat protein
LFHFDAIALPDTTLALGRIKAWLGWFYNDLGFPQKGIDTSLEAIQILQEFDAIEDLVIAYGTIGLIEGYSSNADECKRMMGTAYDLACELEDSPLILASLYWNGIGKFFVSDPDTIDFLDQSESILKKLGNKQWLEGIIQLKSMMLFQQGNYQQCRELILDRMKLILHFNDAYTNADIFLWLALTSIRLNDYEQARPYLLKALRIMWDAGYIIHTAETVVRIAQLYVYESKIQKATEILSILSAESRDLAFHHHITQENIYENLLEECQSRLGSGLFNMAWERGQKQDKSMLIRELLKDLAEA